jgi:restriction system protein
VQALLARVQAMPWREFAATMEAAYQQQGYRVTRLPDGPADLLLHKDGRSTLVACKRWKAANHGADVLRQLAAARRQHDASHSIYVSLAEVDGSTRRTATQERVELLSGVPLAGLLHGLPGLH